MMQICDLEHLTSSFNYLRICRYEMSNCLFEATLQQVERDCNCTPVNYVDIVEG
jgi:hypothetical protein